MNIRVTVDRQSLDRLTELGGLLNAHAERAISTAMSMTRNRWIQGAQQELKSTRADYLLGLSFESSMRLPFEDSGTPNGAVVLTGVFPNMLENGWRPFDEKPGLLASMKARVSKDGNRILSVPFRHGTPGTFMYGVPMPESVYSQAKRLKAGERLNMPRPVGVSWTGYVHRGGSIWNNMVRVQDRPRHHQYKTWRTVSDRSEPRSWWNSGFYGLHMAERLLGFAQSSFDQAMRYELLLWG